MESPRLLGLLSRLGDRLGGRDRLAVDLRAAQAQAETAYHAAVDDYQQAVDLSNRDVDAFLTACRASGATTPQTPPTTEAP